MWHSTPREKCTIRAYVSFTARTGLVMDLHFVTFICYMYIQEIDSSQFVQLCPVASIRVLLVDSRALDLSIFSASY